MSWRAFSRGSRNILCGSFDRTSPRSRPRCGLAVLFSGGTCTFVAPALSAASRALASADSAVSSRGSAHALRRRIVLSEILMTGIVTFQILLPCNSVAGSCRLVNSTATLYGGGTCESPRSGCATPEAHAPARTGWTGVVFIANRVVVDHAVVKERPAPLDDHLAALPVRRPRTPRRSTPAVRRSSGSSRSAGPRSDMSIDGSLFYLSSSSKLDLDSAEATEDGAYPIALRDLVLPGERP